MERHSLRPSVVRGPATDGGRPVLPGRRPSTKEVQAPQKSESIDSHQEEETDKPDTTQSDPEDPETA